MSIGPWQIIIIVLVIILLFGGKKIPELAKIVVFPRQNYYIKSIAAKKLDKKDLIYIKSKKINISSSLIRKFW